MRTHIQEECDDSWTVGRLLDPSYLAADTVFAMALHPLNTSHNSNTRICHVSSNRRSPKG